MNHSCCNITEQAKAYKALLDSLGIKEVMILGFSGGGPAAIEFAAAYPETTLGFIALAAISHGLKNLGKEMIMKMKLFSMDQTSGFGSILCFWSF